MIKLNIDLLLDTVYELVEEIQRNPGHETNSSSALDKFYLSGRESIWAFRQISNSGSSGRLTSYYDTNRFVLTVEYKRDHTCNLPYVPGTNSCNKLFLTALSTIKLLMLGDLEPLPDKIREALALNPYLEELDMQRVPNNSNKSAGFPYITEIKNLKKLSCSVNALEWFRENKIFLKLQFLGIRQTKASLVFDFLSDPCFETEELKIETINLNINPILQLVEKKLQFPSVKKLHYGTNEQEVHGKLPEILPKLLRAFLALFPSLETLNLKISTEPLFISKTEDNFSPSADQLMNNFETMKKAIRNCEISPTVNIVFQNFIRLWFRIPVHELVAYFEDLTKTFSEKKIEGGTTWRIGEKKENVEISMSVSAKKGTGLRFIS